MWSGDKVMGNFSNSGVSQLWPVGQIQTNICLCVSQELKIAYTLLNNWKNPKKDIILYVWK